MSNQLILPMEAYKAKLDQMYKTTNEFKWVSHLVETEKRLQELSDKLSLVLIETGEIHRFSSAHRAHSHRLM